MTTTKTRRIEIDLETHEVRALRLRGIRNSVYCQRCSATVDAFTPEQIAEFLNAGLGDVYRFIEENEIHLVETKSALPLICGNPSGQKHDR